MASIIVRNRLDKKCIHCGEIHRGLCRDNMDFHDDNVTESGRLSYGFLLMNPYETEED